MTRRPAFNTINRLLAKRDGWIIHELSYHYIVASGNGLLIVRMPSHTKELGYDEALKQYKEHLKTFEEP